MPSAEQLFTPADLKIATNKLRKFPSSHLIEPVSAAFTRLSNDPYLQDLQAFRGIGLDEGGDVTSLRYSLVSYERGRVFAQVALKNKHDRPNFIYFFGPNYKDRIDATMVERELLDAMVGAKTAAGLKHHATKRSYYKEVIKESYLGFEIGESRQTRRGTYTLLTQRIK